MKQLVCLSFKIFAVLAAGLVLNGCVGDGVQDVFGGDEEWRLRNEKDRGEPATLWGWSGGK